ncbi:MAG: acetylornithine deacetylase [Succinivibrionaceae bacterium]|nr:acetylornithine deacetylase [Succinivibrionaceae bacterium]
MDHSYFRDLLKQVIEINTISSDNPQENRSNLDLIAMLADQAAELGGDSHAWRVYQTPVAKDNLLIRFGPDVPGGLMLSGHTDTVPCDATGWRTDPFSLAEDDDFFYGLGVIDMKGFFAHALTALRDLGAPLELKKPLYLLATVDEETTMQGAMRFAEQASIAPDAILVGEPTSLIPVIKHKGYMAYSVKVEGKSCHSSNPDAGVSALKIMNRIVAGICDLEEKLKTKFRDEDFKVPYPTLNIGSIRGGDATNRVCGQCEIRLDIRPIRDSSPDDLETILIETVKTSAGEDFWRVSVSKLYPPIPGFGTSADNPLARLAAKLSGRDPLTVSYSTEASLLSSLGSPVVVLGAGSIDDAHQVNEKLPKNEIEKFNGILKEMIRHYCQ